MKIILAIILCVFSYSITYAKEVKDILLLNSYHTGYKWTNDLTSAVLEGIGNPDEYRVFVENMDYKRFQHQGYFFELNKLYKYKYGNIKLDGIICSDNFAFDFFLSKGDSIWNNNVPVVVCGVNNIEKYQFDTIRIKAIKEDIDLANTLKAITQLQPSLDSLLIISDQTLSGKIFLNQALEYIHQSHPHLPYKVIDGTDYTKLFVQLKKVDPQGKAILLLSLYSSRNNIPIEMKALARELLSEVNIPTYSLWDFLLGDLIVGGSILKGYDQGYIAASHLRKRILEPDAYVPAYTSSSYTLMFDYNLLKKYKLKEKNLPESAIFINKEIPFYIKFKKQLIYFLSTLILLVIINLFLITNIIRRKKTELKLIESEKRLELAINSANEGFWDIDIKHQKIFYNDNLRKLLGYKPSDDLNINFNNWQDFINKEDLVKIKNQFKEHLLGKSPSFKFEIKIKRKEGRPHYYAVHGMISEKDALHKPQRITGIVLDIESQKEFEDNLKIAKQRAEESDKMKSEFIANMSHEIRTPMNSIIGFADILDRKNIDHSYQEYINGIRTAGHNLLKLINNILDLSKIEAGKLKLDYTPINLISLLKEVELMFKDRASEKGIELIIDHPKSLPDNVLIDELRVLQMLINLVGNALKFTEKGEIIVKLQLLKTTHKYVNIKFSVSDTGIGIKKENLDKVFKAFEQQENHDTRKYEGAGLGLTISNKLAQLIGSKIEVSSQVGIGSTFSFAMSKVEIYHKALNIQPTKIYSPEKICFDATKVLIVDDNKNNRKILNEYLRDYNFEILEADNGKKATEIAQSTLPDIIFMDIKMPTMSGIEATKIIKSLHLTKHIPIVAITASAISENEVESKNIGFDSYLLKPVSLLEVIKTLTQHLSFKEVPSEPSNSMDANCICNQLANIPIETQNQLHSYFSSLDTHQSMKTYGSIAFTLKKIGEDLKNKPLILLGEQIEEKIKSYNIEDIQKVIETLRRSLKM